MQILPKRLTKVVPIVCILSGQDRSTDRISIHLLAMLLSQLLLSSMSPFIFSVTAKRSAGLRHVRQPRTAATPARGARSARSRRACACSSRPDRSHGNPSRKAQRDIHHALSYAIVAIASSGRKLRIHHLSEVTWTVLRSTREDRKVRHQAALAPFVTQTNVCVMRLVAPILAGNWGYPQPPDPRSSACCALRLQNPVRP